MAITSNIKIENIDNSIELTFNVLGNNGSVYDTAMVAVEFDEIMEVYNVVDYFTNKKEKEFTDKTLAELHAMKMICNIKKKYNA